MRNIKMLLFGLRCIDTDLFHFNGNSLYAFCMLWLTKYVLWYSQTVENKSASASQTKRSFTFTVNDSPSNSSQVLLLLTFNENNTNQPLQIEQSFGSKRIQNCVGFYFECKVKVQAHERFTFNCCHTAFSAVYASTHIFILNLQTIYS